MSKLSYPYRLLSLTLAPYVPRRIKPNHIVLLGLLVFILVPILFFTGRHAMAGIVLVITVWLDHLDGDLARWRKEVSRLGESVFAMGLPDFLPV